MNSLIPHINFTGQCREAMTFYQSCLGGNLNLTVVKDTPVASEFGKELQDKIMHACLETDRFSLMAADLGDGGQSFDSVGLVLDCTSKEEIESLFGRLSEGGSVFCPLGPAFWGGTFGGTKDRFGVSWMLNLSDRSG